MSNPGFTPETEAGRASESLPEFGAFLAISDHWKLTTEEKITLLGKPGRSTFFKWQKNCNNLPADTTERISHILSIWKSLRILFTDLEQSIGWVHKPNKFFENQSAMDIMLQGRVIDLYRVRQYLDAQRGG